MLHLISLKQTEQPDYSVAFQFTGFTSPVDNPPVLNIARAGQTIPLKWRLTDANGNPITNLTDVTATTTSLPCDAGTIGDSIEEYAASNAHVYSPCNPQVASSRPGRSSFS